MASKGKPPTPIDRLGIPAPPDARKGKPAGKPPSKTVLPSTTAKQKAAATRKAKQLDLRSLRAAPGAL
jgi:hypothetical protein